jgi:hypothetical protein
MLLTLFIKRYIVLFTVANDGSMFETQREGNKDRLKDSKNVNKRRIKSKTLTIVRDRNSIKNK